VGKVVAFVTAVVVATAVAAASAAAVAAVVAAAVASAAAVAVAALVASPFAPPAPLGGKLASSAILVYQTARRRWVLRQAYEVAARLRFAWVGPAPSSTS